MSNGYVQPIENYIYLYHTSKFVLLPTYPDSIQDTMNADFKSSIPLSRSAPIYSYSNSGPRHINISLTFHRDMMNDINKGLSTLPVTLTDDYVDTIIKELQSIALPRYAAADKMVDPPLVAIRFGDDIFIKGIVNGGISVAYSGPILTMKSGQNKYALATVSFDVYEVDPYDATQVAQVGGFRGMDSTINRLIGTTSGGFV